MTFYKEVSEKRSERAQDILDYYKDNVAKGKNHSGLKSSNIFDASSAGFHPDSDPQEYVCLHSDSITSASFHC